MVAGCFGAAVKPARWLMALAPAIIRGLHITNTIKSPLDTFIVVWGSGVWQLETHSELWAISQAHRGLGLLFLSPKGAWEPGTFLSSWALPLLSNQPLWCYLWHPQCSGPFYSSVLYIEWSFCTFSSAFISNWMHYQPHNCPFFDWQGEIKLVLFLACLLNINCSSMQLIKKGPTVYHMCPTLIMFTNHTHPPKPKSDPKDMCMRFSNLYLLNTHHHLLFLTPNIIEWLFFLC